MTETKKKILIIDDDKFLLDMYSLKFAGKEYEVAADQGGLEAMARINGGWRPDVILLDLIMPGMDGFAFLEEIKRKNLLNGTKVMVFSNLGQKEDIEKAIKLGAVSYIIKASSTPSEVVTKVEALLK